MMECICEILAGGGVPNSTHKNTPDKFDKSRSALAEARLKSQLAKKPPIPHVGLHVLTSHKEASTAPVSYLLLAY